MTNNFYGFCSLEDYEKGILQLREDLHELTTQNVSEDEALEYDNVLLKARPPYRKGVWAFDDRNNMPADSRIAYVYSPT